MDRTWLSVPQCPPCWSDLNFTEGFSRQTCHNVVALKLCSAAPEARVPTRRVRSRPLASCSQPQPQQQFEKNLDVLKEALAENSFAFPAPVATAACHGHRLPGLAPSLYFGKKRLCKPPIQPPFVSHKCGRRWPREIIRPLFLIYHEVARSRSQSVFGVL